MLTAFFLKVVLGLGLLSNSSALARVRVSDSFPHPYTSLNFPSLPPHPLNAHLTRSPSSPSPHHTCCLQQYPRSPQNSSCSCGMYNTLSSSPRIRSPSLPPCPIPRKASELSSYPPLQPKPSLCCLLGFPKPRQVRVRAFWLYPSRVPPHPQLQMRWDALAVERNG